MACGSLDVFLSFFEKCNRNFFHNCLPKFLSSLQFFKQFAVFEHRADFCKVPNCQYHILIHDKTIDFSSFNIDLNCDFSYQSFDCIFTTFKFYFPCVTPFLSCSKNFYQLLTFTSLKFPVLTEMSFTKKRLLRKKFRTKRTFSKKSVLSFSGTDQTHDLFFKIGSILKWEKRPQFLRTVHDLSSSLQQCQIKNSVMHVPKGSENPISCFTNSLISSSVRSAQHHSSHRSDRN